MEQFVKSLRHPETWTISVQLLVLYVVSTFLFFALYSANRKVAVRCAGLPLMIEANEGAPDNVKVTLSPSSSLALNGNSTVWPRVND